MNTATTVMYTPDGSRRFDVDLLYKGNAADPLIEDFTVQEVPFNGIPRELGCFEACDWLFFFQLATEDGQPTAYAYECLADALALEAENTKTLSKEDML